ncbi:MAG: hypothetical protein ABJA90_08110 [Ginsengibacter sp.]
MATTSHVPSKVTALIAVAFLLPALIFFLMWLSIGFQSDMNANEKIDIYLHKYPAFMRNISAIGFTSIVCCVLSMIFAARSFKKHLLSVRVLMMLTVIADLVLILFNINQIL